MRHFFTWKSVHIHSTNIDLTKRPGNCATIKSVGMQKNKHKLISTPKKKEMNKKQFLLKKRYERNDLTWSWINSYAMTELTTMSSFDTNRVFL